MLLLFAATRVKPSMDQPTATLIIGALTSAVTVGGWIVLHYLTAGREADARQDARQKDLDARIAADMRADRVKRLEILLEDSESQISEFYGPLDALIRQIWATWEIKNQMKPKLDAETYAKVDHHFGLFYFGELHSRIRSILQEKAYLLDGGRMPDSFYAYMKHSIMENIQIDLWEKRQISTLNIEGFSWPYTFPQDVERGLNEALRRRQEILSELQPAQSMNAGANLSPAIDKPVVHAT
jgi:hypothetical protein